MERVPNTDFPLSPSSCPTHAENCPPVCSEFSLSLFGTPIVSPPPHTPPTLRNVVPNMDCVGEGLKPSRLVLAFPTLPSIEHFAPFVVALAGLTLATL
jgi:hypothetical protein